MSNNIKQNIKQIVINAIAAKKELEGNPQQPIVEQDKEEDWAGVYNYTDKKQDKDIDTLAKEFARMKLGSDRKYLDTVGKDRFDCIVIGYKANTVNKELESAVKLFLKVINRSPAALYHYQDAINAGEKALAKAEQLNQ